MIRKRDRRIYFVSILAVIIAGLGSRKYSGFLPMFISEYSGDTLWGLMIFLLTGFLFSALPTLQTTVLSLIFCFAIEFSQLYTSDWIDNVRHTLLGGLILGYGFLWSDLICYTAGIILGALIEKFLLLKKNYILK